MSKCPKTRDILTDVLNFGISGLPTMEIEYVRRALAELDEMEAENKRYREAIIWISEQCPSERCVENRMIAKAKQALKESKK